MTREDALGSWFGVTQTFLVAMGCLAMAVGLDFDEEPFESLRHFSKSIEEFLEMLSMTILWAVFVHHLMGTARRLRVEFVESGG